jgi:hypothetical protein
MKQLPVASEHSPVVSSQLSVSTDRIDRWAQPLCTALLILGASYIVGHLMWAWLLGRLSGVAR